MSGLEVFGNECKYSFDMRVFDPNACRYRNKSLQQCHVMNEHEKKQAYNERILQIEHDTFTTLVFSINGSTGRECQKFYSRLAHMISEKRDLPQSISSNWIQTKVCLGFAKTKSALFKEVESSMQKNSEI